MASWVPRARCCHPPERHLQAGFSGFLNTVMGPSEKRRHMSVQNAGMAENMEVCKTYENIENILKNSPHAEQKPLGPN